MLELADLSAFISREFPFVLAYLGKILLICHDDIMFESDNDILVCTILEIIGNDPRVVLLDIIIVRTALLETTKVPSDDVFACRSDDSLFRLVDSGVETCWSKVDG